MHACARKSCNALRAIGGEAVARAGALEKVWEHLSDAVSRRSTAGIHAEYTIEACLGILATSGEAGKRFTPGLLGILVQEYPTLSEPPRKWGPRAGDLSRTLAALWFDEATEEAPIVLRSPQPDVAPFELRVGRQRWQEGPSIDLIAPFLRWGMA